MSRQSEFHGQFSTPRTRESVGLTLRFLTNFPWMFRIRDNNGHLAFHCGLCNRHATTNHLLSHENNKKATHTNPWVASRLFPQWMRRWHAPRTDAEGDGFFT